MNYLFISLFVYFFLSLVSCSAIVKDESEIDKIADDIIKEIVEDLTKK